MRRVSVRIGEVIRAEPGIVEVQGKGRMHRGRILVQAVPEPNAVRFHGLIPGNRTWNITNNDNRLQLGETIDAKVLEVRPAGE